VWRGTWLRVPLEAWPGGRREGAGAGLIVEADRECRLVWRCPADAVAVPRPAQPLPASTGRPLLLGCGRPVLRVERTALSATFRWSAGAGEECRGDGDADGV